MTLTNSNYARKNHYRTDNAMAANGLAVGPSVPKASTAMVLALYRDGPSPAYYQPRVYYKSQNDAYFFQKTSASG